MWYSAEYSTFFISDEAGKYRMTVAGYSEDAGDAIMMSAPEHNTDGKMFSTVDRGCNCAADHGGGWWFGWCNATILNLDTKARWHLSHEPPVVHDIQIARMFVKVE